MPRGDRIFDLRSSQYRFTLRPRPPRPLAGLIVAVLVDHEQSLRTFLHVGPSYLLLQLWGFDNGNGESSTYQTGLNFTAMVSPNLRDISRPPTMNK